jgi:hypothetical protein
MRKLSFVLMIAARLADARIHLSAEVFPKSSCEKAGVQGCLALSLEAMGEQSRLEVVKSFAYEGKAGQIFEKRALPKRFATSAAGGASPAHAATESSPACSKDIGMCATCQSSCKAQNSDVFCVTSELPAAAAIFFSTLVLT